MENPILLVFKKEICCDLWFLQNKIILNISKPFEEFGSEYIHKKVNYLLIIKDEEDLLFIIKRLALNPNYNTKEKHLIVTEKTLDGKRLKHCFELLWQQNVYNVVITTKNTNTITTWYPYGNNSNCGNNVVIEINITTPFSNKIPKTFTNCKVKLIWKSYSILTTNPKDSMLGFNNQMLLLIGEKNGLDMHFEPEENKLVYKEIFNKTHTVQLAQYVTENKVDIIANMYSTDSSKLLDKGLEISSTCILHKSLWLLPSKQPLSSIQAFLSALTLQQYILNLFTFFSFLFVYRLASKNFFIVIQIFLQQPIHSTTKGVTKLLLILGLFFTIHMGFLYSSQLIRVLYRPVYPPSFKTLKELLEKTDLKFSFTSYAIEILQKRNTELWKKLETRTAEVFMSMLSSNVERKNKFLNLKGVLQIGFYDLYYINNPQDLEILEEEVSL